MDHNNENMVEAISYVFCAVKLILLGVVQSAKPTVHDPIS